MATRSSLATETTDIALSAAAEDAEAMCAIYNAAISERGLNP
jgi:hypothetical protein